MTLILFEGNIRAVAFYKAVGYALPTLYMPSSVLSHSFVLDPSSPNYVGSDGEDEEVDEDVDYEILSKSVT